MKNHSKLNSQERDRIAIWYSQGVSIREIGRRLFRNSSTISREIQRNNHREAGYVAIHAQALTEERKEKARKRHPLKNPVVYASVFEKLRRGWSPELIAGRLKRKYRKSVIHHETIYRFIYAKENRAEQLWEYLPRKRKKRQTKYGRKVHRSHIPDRVSIHERPDEINERQELGHWEGDTLEGKNDRESLHVEAERLSRFLLVGRILRIASLETVQTQCRLFNLLPQEARRSATFDNGRENHLHTKLHDLGMKTYFCDPYSAWQRGTVEFHNGLLRRYFPKGTDFATVSDQELQEVVREINNRPRKCLGFATPAEVFLTQLSVAIQQRI